MKGRKFDHDAGDRRVGQRGDDRAGHREDGGQATDGDLLAEAGHLDGAAGQDGAVAAGHQVAAPGAATT